MKILKSKKIKIPEVFFITDRSEIKELPIGVPFILGRKRDEEYLVRILEYEVLYQQAIKSGYPFNFKQILKDNGFLDVQDFGYGDSVYMEFTTEGLPEEIEFADLSTLRAQGGVFKEFIKDSAVYVDITKLKELNVFPVWLDKIEDAVYQNIHNFATFNPNMYNKKLEGMYGGIELAAPNRNLIIIDISGSIPRGVSSTCLALAKNLSETFYADLMITGSITSMYPYENLHELNIDTIYDENGMNNDQAYYKQLISSEEKHYQTCICFGDNDEPGHDWTRADKTISNEDGKKLNKWKINKVISFHTRGTDYLAGYCRWFTPDSEERIADWVKYL